MLSRLYYKLNVGGPRPLQTYLFERSQVQASAQKHREAMMLQVQSVLFGLGASVISKQPQRQSPIPFESNWIPYSIVR